MDAEKLREMGLEKTRERGRMSELERLREEYQSWQYAWATGLEGSEDELRLSAEALIAALEAALAAVERERDRREWVLDYVLGQARAVDLYYDVPEARVGDVDDVKRCLLARYDAAHPAPEEEADREGR